MSTVTKGNIRQWKIKQLENKVATCREIWTWINKWVFVSQWKHYKVFNTEGHVHSHPKDVEQQSSDYMNEWMKKWISEASNRATNGWIKKLTTQLSREKNQVICSQSQYKIHKNAFVKFKDYLAYDDGTERAVVTASGTTGLCRAPRPVRPSLSPHPPLRASSAFSHASPQLSHRIKSMAFLLSAW